PFFSQAATRPSYFTRVLRTENGLPQNSVAAVLQTRDGYLWVGTYNGLARYDGDSFTVFDADKSNTPEMRSSRVVSLFEDNSGTLWIGHETGELTRYKDGKFEAVDFRMPWEKRKIAGIGSDEGGNLWLLNEDGRLAALSGGSVSVPDPGAATKVAAMARNSRGQIWVAYAGSVYALTNGRLVTLSTNEATLGGYVTGLCPSSDGGLWLVSGDHIRKWKDGALVDDLGPTTWGQSSITACVELRNGTLAVGTLEQSLFLISSNHSIQHFDRSNGFPHDWTRCLFEDNEGTLWAGTGNGGLVAVRAGKVTTLNPPDLWHERDVMSVMQAHDGAIWVSSEGSGLYRWQNNQWTHYTESEGLYSLFVWSVTEDARHQIWIGTWGGGIYILRGDRPTQLEGMENLTLPATAFLHHDGATWIGTGAGLLRYENGRTKWYRREDGLTVPDVRAVVADGSGGIWFGMMGGGLACLRDGNLRQFHKADGLANEYVQALHWDSAGALWIGTYGGGLNRLKDGRFSSISTAEGLPSNVLCDIEDDGLGYLWFSSRKGIFRISKDELNRCADGKLKSVRCLTYGTGDGMPTLECSGGFQPAGCKSTDGRLWFPTSKGLVVIDPADVKVNQHPPPVVIEKVMVEGQNIVSQARSNSPVLVPPGHQRFAFHYSALTFIAPEKVHFRYRLKGFEDEWMAVGTKRVADYSYVPPGDYAFQVIACNSDGVWNETGASFAFTVQPHLWQCWWFRILEAFAGGTVLVAVVLVIYRRRVRLKLERLERQRAIERERSRIAQDIHDNLGASLTHISLLSQSAYSELDNPSHAATQLDRIYNTARELTRAMDEIVWAVNPKHDTLDSLASYLGKFAQDFLGPLHIRCRLDVPVHLPAWPVTAEVRHNLFLALKEALHNVVKHAAATEVSVSLVTKSDVFTIILHDNGRGFDPETVHRNAPDGPDRFASGNGLINMRQRLEKIGGRCEIESPPGKGTTVRFIVTAPKHS
ncbi:MAG TPA: two-component regulator propeller domain-containing protein, partial [Candidatus Paceibacterota bacterium]|nr:two-component regulator propeller domain-containing protein [Candidatus Paceibacterota bacterium]